MTDTPEHFEWEERLQDWIDGDLDAHQCSVISEHVASCASCRAQMRALRAIDAALSESFSQITPERSFDRKVLERVDAMAQAHRAAARQRLERERQTQMALLSRQWRSAWRSMTLNGLAGAAVLVALLTTFDIIPWVSGLIDQAGLLVKHASIHPAMTLPVAAGLAVSALWLVRALASTGR